MITYAIVIPPEDCATAAKKNNFLTVNEVGYTVELDKKRMKCYTKMKKSLWTATVRQHVGTKNK